MSTIQGLSSNEAKARLLKDGANQMVSSGLESGFADMRKILMDPMGLMLLTLAGLHLAIGDSKDAWILLAAYVPVTAIDVLLELRAQKALREMRSALSATAKVLRDGTIGIVPVREIVVGDVLVFEEGQSLPADGEILESSNLTANEAALTGESVPIEKTQGQPFYAGTTLVQGRGMGLVQTTGKNTKFGAIAKLLEETKGQLSPLQRKVNRLIRLVLFVALGLAVILFVVERGRGHDWIDSLIIAMTFGMAAIPEEFPLVFTLYLSLGAWRLSKHGVLIRSLPSVEALGGVDVICTDKTGTLTEGQFQLEALSPTLRSEKSLSEQKLWQMALMACEENAVDAMDVAIKLKGAQFLPELTGWSLKWDYPFEGLGKHMSHVWIQSQSSQTIIAMKGAVEGVLEHCTLSGEERDRILSEVDIHARQGQRILGLAGREGLCIGDRDKDEVGLTFLGLLLFSDPVRASATTAIAACAKMGIEIKMLTGDHPMTALAVAEKIGMRHGADDIFGGNELTKMSPEQRTQAYRKGTIFYRVQPEQKYEMVQALKDSGKVVAMTGDGVNDAPALKLADIGISMGLSATDVARSTAQMILVKNDFNGIIEAIYEGQKIFSNLRRSFAYLISFHIPVILLALLPPLLGWGELLLSIHIVLLELIVHPISAFAFENLPNTESSRERSILPLKRFIRSAVLGLLVSGIALALFRWKESEGQLDLGRSLAMSAILLGNMGFVVIESNFLLNRRVVLTLLGLILFSVAIFVYPPFAGLLHLSF